MKVYKAGRGVAALIHKAYCLLSSSPHFAYIWVFNQDGKTLAWAQSQLRFKVSVTELSNAVNAGMAKQTEGRQLALSRKYPPSVSSLVVSTP